MSDDVIRQYSGLLHKLCEDEKLCPLDRTAVAGIIEYGVRLAGRRNKVTAPLSGPRRSGPRGLLRGAPGRREPGHRGSSAQRAQCPHRTAQPD